MSEEQILPNPLDQIREKLDELLKRKVVDSEDQWELAAAFNYGQAQAFYQVLIILNSYQSVIGSLNKANLDNLVDSIVQSYGIVFGSALAAGKQEVTYTDAQRLYLDMMKDLDNLPTTDTNGL
ncbi:hypothetical protein PBI_GRAYSON_35 [Rhodococcus phage Grayson]|nr:hypothetical protein PBI_GRAYSON_35 [Rhodococcus phage Grayson]